MRLGAIGPDEPSYYAPICWSLTGASREGRLVCAARFCACNRKDDSAAFLRLASIRDTGCRFNDAHGPAHEAIARQKLGAQKLRGEILIARLLRRESIGESDCSRSRSRAEGQTARGYEPSM